MGRAHVAASERESLLILHRELRTLDDRTEPAPVRRARRLALRFLDIEHAIFVEGNCHYDNYLNLPILEDFVLAASDQDTIDRCRLALSAIANDWLKHEERALKLSRDGLAPHGFSTSHVESRIARLGQLAGVAAVRELPADVPGLNRWLPRLDDWTDLSEQADGLLALVYLTALPQSRFHDEMMFIRITHLAECCFIGAVAAIRAGAAGLEQARPSQVCAWMKEASLFTGILLQAFSTIFRTLPYENFYAGFRPETGNSSAIQSRNYQALDGLVRGFGRRKRAVLRDQPLVDQLADRAEFGGSTLGDMLQAAQSCPGWTQRDRGELIYHASRISNALKAWRTFHLGIARDYLPPEARGTGGMGVQYLEQTLQEPGEPCPREGLDMLGAIRPVHTTALARSRHRRGVVFWIQALQCDLRAMAASECDVPARHAPLTELRKLLGGEGCVRVDLHNDGRLTGDLWVDLAMSGEFFIGADGRQRRCGAFEEVLRDGKGIFVAARQGASRRTALQLARAGSERSARQERRTVGLSVMAPAEVPDAQTLKIVECCVAALTPISDAVSVFSSLDACTVEGQEPAGRD